MEFESDEVFHRMREFLRQRLNVSNWWPLEKPTRKRALPLNTNALESDE